MADRRRPTPPARPDKGSKHQKGGGGWQKPVAPPKQEKPDGLPKKPKQ